MGEHADRPGTLVHDGRHPIDPSPATTRSTIASAWSGEGRHLGQGRSVERSSRALAAGSSGAACSTSPVPGRSSVPWRAARAAPVEQLVPGDGEHPGPEGRLVALEAGDARSPQPGLRGQVLGDGRRDDPEVPQQAGLQVAPELPERLLVAAGGGAEHVLELRTDHRPARTGRPNHPSRFALKDRQPSWSGTELSTRAMKAGSRNRGPPPQGRRRSSSARPGALVEASATGSAPTTPSPCVAGALRPPPCGLAARPGLTETTLHGLSLLRRRSGYREKCRL